MDPSDSPGKRTSNMALKKKKGTTEFWTWEAKSVCNCRVEEGDNLLGKRNIFAKILTGHSKALCHYEILSLEVGETLSELRKNFSFLVQE